MEFYTNPEKSLYIEVDGVKYLRTAIRTHFVTPGENYIEIIDKYVKPIYKEGDILSISEKIIALCQNRVIYRKDVKVGFWAKFLAKFVMKTPAGFSVGNPLKMQVAIMQAGLPRILFAAFCSAVTKLYGKKGVFYKVAGHDINGLDGFYGGAYKEYEQMGIFNPDKPSHVCNEIKEKLGITAMIVDANDLGVEILGKPDSIALNEEKLKKLIKDNPAGQDNQQTPFILIRKAQES